MGARRRLLGKMPLRLEHDDMARLRRVLPIRLDNIWASASIAIHRRRSVWFWKRVRYLIYRYYQGIALAAKLTRDLAWAAREFFRGP
jgi:hypothetical protein